MTQPTLETLVRRIERLEHENRRLKATGLLALLALISVVVMGQAGLSGPPVVEAQKFYVRDGDGKARAALDVNGLALMDADGSVWTVVGRGHLVINDKVGKAIWKAP
jgi:hypothetical protein